MQRSKVEQFRGRWVTVTLASGRKYTGFFRKLKTEGSWQMFSCGSSGPFVASSVKKIEIPAV